MRTIKLTLIGFFTLFLAVEGYAMGQKQPEDDDIVEVKFQEVIPTAEELYSDSLENIPQVSTSTDLTLLTTNVEVDAMILLGEKVLQIVKKGAPVVNVQRDSLAVVPKGISDWSQLAGWQTPVTKVFQVTMVNRFKQVRADLRLKVSAVYGGNYKNVGRYLSNVTMVPTALNVGWGLTLDVWTEAREPVNVGSAKQPVAGLGFDVRYRARTWISDLSGVQDFFVNGNGELLQLQ